MVGLEHKAKILILVDWYLPGFKGGGQIKAVEYIVENLKAEFDFHILCRDHDVDGTVYDSIVKDRWIERDGIKIKYLSKNFPGNFFKIFKEIRCGKWDTVYINSFFSSFFSIFPFFQLRFRGPYKIRTILAPRGEFSLGALAGKKFKKNLFLLVAKVCSLHEYAVWQASTEFEKLDILRLFPHANVVIAKELLPILDSAPVKYIHKESGKIKALFFSRISPKKGLDIALDILAMERNASIALDIYGPLEDAVYWNMCQRKIELLPSNIEIKYCGELAHSQVKETIPLYHFLLFPTLGENFGYVIIETFLSSRPVLISDRTPWRELSESGVGFEVPLERLDLFHEKLRILCELNDENFNIYVKRVKDFTDIYVAAQSKILDSNRALFSAKVAG